MVTGDSRGSFEQINTEILSEIAAEAVRVQPDFVLFTGDMAYSGGIVPFTQWKNIMTDVYDAGIAVYPIIGNHEANDPEAFEAVFGGDIPRNGPVEQLGRTYFVAHKNALVLGLDQFTAAGVLDQAWIDSVLATNKAPHVFAMGHMPAFKVLHYDCLDDYAEERDAFWTSLKRSGCRAYFAGHDHFYDHMRVGDGDENPGNDVHQLIVGTAGAPLYPDAEYDGENGAWNPTRVYYDQNFGYALVEVDGPNVTLTWNYRTAPGVYESTDSWSYAAIAPARLNIERLSSSQLRLWFAGQSGVTYVTEGSSDLVSWVPISTNTVMSGRIELAIDCLANPSKLFRVRGQ